MDALLRFLRNSLIAALCVASPQALAGVVVVAQWALSYGLEGGSGYGWVVRDPRIVYFKDGYAGTQKSESQVDKKYARTQLAYALAAASTRRNGTLGYDFAARPSSI